jgi:hypothetical protein
MTDTTRFANFRHFLQRGVAALYAEGTAVARDADYILYYTPFEHENPEAELVIVGITPGPDQLDTTYAEAPKLLSRGLSDLAILAELKRHGAFGGDMRPNLCKMLLAERAGFEPAVRLSPYTRFPGVRLKPLIHLSGTTHFIMHGISQPARSGGAKVRTS